VLAVEDSKQLEQAIKQLIFLFAENKGTQFSDNLG